jgi:hypothetical protein
MGLFGYLMFHRCAGRTAASLGVYLKNGITLTCKE